MVKEVTLNINFCKKNIEYFLVNTLFFTILSKRILNYGKVRIENRLGKESKIMKKLRKIIGRVLLLSSFLAAGVLALPQHAHALGWNASTMLNSVGGSGNGKFSATTVNQDTVASWVQSISTWALAIAIVIFVGKVVATAIDRMLFDKPEYGKDGKLNANTAQETFLTKIGYPRSMPWKEIWMHFGKNLAIVVGIWILVQLIMGVVQFLFTWVEGNVK